VCVEMDASSLHVEIPLEGQLWEYRFLLLLLTTTAYILRSAIWLSNGESIR
jgi:hypothetical protein